MKILSKLLHNKNATNKLHKKEREKTFDMIKSVKGQRGRERALTDRRV